MIVANRYPIVTRLVAAAITAVGRVALALLVLGLAPMTGRAAPELTWIEPGRDSQDSMPLGNGDLGLNVWTEPDGAVLFYIGKTDAWSEARNTELVKLARVRVVLTPNPFAGAKDFRQTLSADEAALTISGGGARLRLWVDANAPVIHGEVQAATPVSLVVSLDPWRTASVGPVTADVVTPAEADRLVWYHRNAAIKVEKKLANRTFGGAIFGVNLVRSDLNSLNSAAPAARHAFSVVALTTGTGPLEDWRASLDRLVTESRARDRAADWAAHVAWWKAFWARSHLRVSGDAVAEQVSAGYAWQRFITACAGRGAYPIKFNGSIFVTDNPGNTRREKGNPVPIADPFNADQRAWGGRYWFQNTRPMYWPRLAARRTEKSRFGTNPSACAPTLSVADRFWGLKHYFGLWPVGLGRLIHGASGFFWCLRVGFPALARLGRPQFGVEAMKTLKVVGQAHQIPFEGYFFQSAH